MIRDNGISYMESLSSIELNNIFNNKYRGNTPLVLYANGGSWNKLSMRERYNYIHSNYDILANGGTLDDIKKRFAEGGDVPSDDLMTAKIDVLTPKNFSYPYREKLRNYSFKDRRESDNVLDFRGVGLKHNEMLRELPLYMYYYFPSAKKQVFEALKGNFIPDYYEDVNDIPELWKNDRMKRIDFLNDKYGLQGKDRMRYFAEGGEKEGFFLKLRTKAEEALIKAGYGAAVSILDRLPKNRRLNIMYRIMSQGSSNGTKEDRDWSDIIKAIQDSYNEVPMSDNRYTGSWRWGKDEKGFIKLEPNTERDLNLLFTKGNVKGLYTEMPSEEIRGVNPHPEAPTYYGSFVPNESFTISTEFEPLLQYLADNNMGVPIWNGTNPKSIELPLSDKEVEESQDRGFTVDNVGNFIPIIGRDKEGNPEMLFYDYNNYGKEYSNLHGSNRIKSAILGMILDHYGTPVNLRLYIPINVVSPEEVWSLPEDLRESIEQMEKGIMDVAEANNVMTYDPRDNTFSPIREVLPEVEVTKLKSLEEKWKDRREPNNVIDRRGQVFLIDNEFKSGGSIHIKPENRGKFTALKKRTGHSASWFKAHGTPAQRKMATFALNSRKWKHGDGGYLYDGESENTQLMYNWSNYNQEDLFGENERTNYVELLTPKEKEAVSRLLPPYSGSAFYKDAENNFYGNPDSTGLLFLHTLMKNEYEKTKKDSPETPIYETFKDNLPHPLPYLIKKESTWATDTADKSATKYPLLVDENGYIVDENGLWINQEGYPTDANTEDDEKLSILNNIFKNDELHYIGGNQEETRKKYWKEYPRLGEITDSIAGMYGIDPSLLRNNLNHEGIIDKMIKANNDDYEDNGKLAYRYYLNTPTDMPLFLYKEDGTRGKREYIDWLVNQPGYGTGFNDFGLDNTGSLLELNKLNLKDSINYVTSKEVNEKKQNVTAGEGKTTLGNLHLSAAHLKYLSDLVKKDFPNLSLYDHNRYVRAYYNRGRQGAIEWAKRGAKGYNYKNGGHLFDEGGETGEEYYPIWLDGITVKPSGNRPTTRDDWSWANWRELQNEREQQAAESVRRGIDRNGTPIAAGIFGLAAAPFAIEGLGSSAVANGVRTGLNAMNTAFTPSTWLNPVTGAKLLSPTVGTIADAGIQGAFAYEGLNGLWNQGREGTLLSDPASTFMHGLEVLPLIGLGSKAVGMGVDAWNKSGMKALWDISRNDTPVSIESSVTPRVAQAAKSTRMTPENTMSAYGFRDYMSNAEFRDAYNAFAKKYGYDEMPVGLSREKMNRMAQKAIADHNTFYRGVVYEGAAPEDIESVAQILGHEPSEEEFLQYAATHPRPTENAIFVSPSPNLASMYGKTARVERPYTLGNNRMNWFNEGEYTIGGNNSGADLINPWISKYNPNAAPTELLLPDGVFRGWVDTAPKTTAESVAPINFMGDDILAGSNSIYSDSGKASDIFSQFVARNKISGKAMKIDFDSNGQMILVPEEEANVGLPISTKNRLNRSVVDRNIREFEKEGAYYQGYREKVNKLMDEVKWNEYSDADYDAAGYSDFGGFYDPQTGFISIRRTTDFPKERIFAHEGRHLIDNNTGLLDSQQKLLYNAYGDDFINIPNTKYAQGLENYKNMDKEMITTNLDARTKLLGNKEMDFDLDMLDKIIDKSSDNRIFEAVEKANGYGRRYIAYLRDNNLLTPEKAQAFREAMKYVGGYILGIGAAGAAGNKYFNQDQGPIVKMAMGGKLFGEGGQEQNELSTGNIGFFNHPLLSLKYYGSPLYDLKTPFTVAFTDAIIKGKDNFMWNDKMYSTNIDWNKKFEKDDKGNIPFQEFANYMYPAVIKILKEKGLPLTNAHNIVRLAGLESLYGTNPVSGKGYNLSGIKWNSKTMGNYNHATNSKDNLEYVDFDNLKDYLEFKIDLLNNRYDAVNAENDKDFVDRLHLKSSGINKKGFDYSTNYKGYLNMLLNTKSLDKWLKLLYTPVVTQQGNL